MPSTSSEKQINRVGISEITSNARRIIVVRAATTEQVKAALARPEVACTLVPSEDLLDLDLRKLTYG